MPAVDTSPLAIDGGAPVRPGGGQWPAWPVWDECEEEALLGVLRSGIWWYVGGGQGVSLENEFAALHGAAHGVACTNGTAALYIALRAMGIGFGDEVIVPPYTFIATASSVLAAGATPVFVDIEGDTLNIDPAAVSAAVTERTRAIIPVHVAGRPADMDGIQAVAERHGLAILEDAAQAHLAEWRGRPVGAIGAMGTFSLQASKNLNAGEGGLIITNDERLADAAWSVMNVGRVRSGKWYEHHVLGSNFRMTEFQAAIARVQMTRLEAQTDRRTAGAAHLRRRLAGIPGINLAREDERITRHANHLFTYRMDPDAFGGHTCAQLVAALNAEGVPASTGYVPLYRESVFRRFAAGEEGMFPPTRPIDYSALHLPVCEAACQDTVWIPQQFLLAEPRDLDDIATAIDRVQAAWSH